MDLDEKIKEYENSTDFFNTRPILATKPTAVTG